MIMLIESCLSDDQRVYICRDQSSRIVFCSADVAKLTDFIKTNFDK